MAQYFTDFSQHTAGAGVPAGWSERWDTSNSSFSIVDDAGVTGGKHLRHSVDSSTFWPLLSFDAVDSDTNRDNIEVVARLRHVGIAAFASMHGVAVRASGSNAAKNGYYSFFVRSETPSSYGGRWRFRKNLNNVVTTLANEVDGAGITNTWGWVRLQATGTTVRYRTWVDTDPEPAGWDAEVTDTDLPDAGWVGIQPGAAAGYSYDYDVFGAGTNGDPAPTEAVDEGTEGALLGPNGRLLRGPNGGLLRLAGA